MNAIWKKNKNAEENQHKSSAISACHTSSNVFWSEIKNRCSNRTQVGATIHSIAVGVSYWLFC